MRKAIKVQAAPPPVLLRRSDVAQQYQLSERTICRLIASGHLKAEKVPGTRNVRLKAEDVLAWATSSGRPKAVKA